MWIITAWQHVSPEVFVKGFECCISNNMDGTNDDILWIGNKEDGSVRSSCKEDEGTDCEDGDSDTHW